MKIPDLHSCEGCRWFLWLAIALATTTAQAQSLPPASRTVFKCTVNGVATYSDTPCVGAQRLDVEPTRGADKISGRLRAGNDVRREHTREVLVDALKPLTGMDAKQFDVHARRRMLTPAVQRECKTLDAVIPTLERRETGAQENVRQEVQLQLYNARKRFREIRC